MNFSCNSSCVHQNGNSYANSNLSCFVPNDTSFFCVPKTNPFESAENLILSHQFDQKFREISNCNVEKLELELTNEIFSYAKMNDIISQTPNITHFPQNISNKNEDILTNADTTIMSVDEESINEMAPLLTTGHIDTFDDVNTTYAFSDEFSLMDITPTFSAIENNAHGEELERNSRNFNDPLDLLQNQHAMSSRLFEEELKKYDNRTENDRIIKQSILTGIKVAVFGSMLTIEGSEKYYRCIADPKKERCERNQEVVNEAIRLIQRVRAFGRDLINIDKEPELYERRRMENRQRTHECRENSQY